jgi:hypothetical protein
VEPVSILKHTVEIPPVSDSDFSTQKKGIFRPGHQIEQLRGGAYRHTTRASTGVDTAGACPVPDPGAEKNHFRTETNRGITAQLLTVYAIQVKRTRLIQMKNGLSGKRAIYLT